MTEYVYVRPRPGGRVRMPDRNFMPMDAKGATVPRIDYYERLIISGDVEICDPPVAEHSSVDSAIGATASSSPARTTDGEPELARDDQAAAPAPAEKPQSLRLPQSTKEK
ncbi:hypothetical protein BF49_3618 [Bradyrhizobium sp.]|uniref:DUF2635 domain-containing protein n=1 Tax=Bradyrhizobium sp. TaxID=376 RepID=UPI0007C18365|nr:DUF2635 domain-containing protein [Bradyrhizobium sp.]CUT12538.1 hypothetical protein BF49_3618 [Bradyrhizobium sp.]